MFRTIASTTLVAATIVVAGAWTAGTAHATADPCTTAQQFNDAGGNIGEMPVDSGKERINSDCPKPKPEKPEKPKPEKPAPQPPAEPDNPAPQPQVPVTPPPAPSEPDVTPDTTPVTPQPDNGDQRQPLVRSADRLAGDTAAPIKVPASSPRSTPAEPGTPWSLLAIAIVCLAAAAALGTYTWKTRSQPGRHVKSTEA